MPKRSWMRLEGQHRTHDGAVGVGDDVAARLLAPGLLLDQMEVIGVDLWQDQRHVGRHAEGAGVGDDGAAGGGELGFEFAGEGCIDRREDDFGRAFWLGRRNDHLGDALGQDRVQTPLGGFAVSFASGAVAGGQPNDLEPGMVFQQLDVALADHAGRAEDADGEFVFHSFQHSSVQEEGVLMNGADGSPRIPTKTQNRPRMARVIGKPERIPPNWEMPQGMSTFYR